MTNELEMPEWRKAWKLDDPMWMKERKAKWKTLKQRLPIVAWFLRKDDLAELKNYFLYGHGYYPAPPREKWKIYHYDPNMPLTVEAPVIFECWLSADQSDEYFQLVLKRNIVELRHGDGTIEYSKSLIETSRRRFRELMSGSEFPKEGGLFDGLEARLYFLFGADPPDYAFSVSVLQRYISVSPPNEFDIGEIVLEEFCQTVKNVWMNIYNEQGEKRAKDGAAYTLPFLKKVHEVLTGNHVSTNEQLFVAERIMECMSSANYPAVVKKMFKKYIQI